MRQTKVERYHTTGREYDHETRAHKGFTRTDERNALNRIAAQMHAFNSKWQLLIHTQASQRVGDVRSTRRSCRSPHGEPQHQASPPRSPWHYNNYGKRWRDRHREYIANQEKWEKFMKRPTLKVQANIDAQHRRGFGEQALFNYASYIGHVALHENT